ncbi:2-dehydro-3-deoxygalactonokinase [Primorskyibacter flagellatus]|uniref:2-dehydro-3-deoxygalactonokinase n=1 Tax=Primorskyibacter flagellatus TaxID=1387277 RepID=UPI003A93402C
MTQADWIAVDWGTSNVRAWIFDERGEAFATASSDKGMGSLDPAEFEPALIELVGQYLPETGKVPVIACGMVGARQGWAEAPYATCPCPPPGLADAVSATAADPRLDVSILPGVKQSGPADVMRGEETQIGGFLATEPGFDGILCLPGTHTKWVHISAGEIVSFRTCMTGEIFALLSRQSVLRFAVTGDGWDAQSFRAAVSDAMSSPQNFSAWLFGLRADSLLNGTGVDVSRARLSGLLLGLELAGTKPYWLGRDVVIIGAPALTDLYVTALAEQGVSARFMDGADLSLAGIRAARAQLESKT